MKKVRGINDFLMGNRSINPWMSAFSYGTAYFSAVIFIGYAGKIGWANGLSSLWIAFGNTLVGSFLAWHLLGRRTREMTTRLKASTMPEFFAVRYDSKALKVASALIIFLFLIPYSASVYKGLTYLFEETFGIPNIAALLIMTVLTALYLFLGGFIASTLADFVQGLVMIFGVIIMLFYIVSHPAVGGLGQAIPRLADIDPSLVKPVGAPGALPMLSLVLLTSLGSWGLPQMVHKFYTIKSEKSIFCAKWVSTGFALIITIGAYFTGSLSRLFFPEAMPVVNGISNPDVIIPRIFSLTLPPWVGGIILVLVLSASMSTLASLVLASSSAIALDLVKGALRPNIRKDRLMLLMRLLCVVFVIMSFILAVLPNPILSLAALSWGAISGCMLAPYLYGLFWKRVTKAGIWSGIAAALSIVIGGALLKGLNSPLIPTISASAIVLPLFIVPAVSMMTKGYSPVHLRRIFNEGTETDIDVNNTLAEELV